MPSYGITFAQSARKEMEHLDSRAVGRIFPKIEALAENPRPTGCRKIHGFRDLWRIRVGDWRVIYSINDNSLIVDIVAVRHRSSAYKF